MTVGDCRNEEHVDECMQWFDESGFVRKVDEESKDGVCSDESSLARIFCTSWVLSSLSVQELMDIWG